MTPKTDYRNEVGENKTTVLLTITTHPDRDTDISIEFAPPMTNAGEPSLAATLALIALRAIKDWCFEHKRKNAEFDAERCDLTGVK